MFLKKYFFLILSLSLVIACQEDTAQSANTKIETTPEIETSDAPIADEGVLHYAAEEDLRNIRQLTFGGDNAEAYFSFDNNYLVFQANNPEWGTKCDQIYYMPKSGTKGHEPPRLSTGKGRTTCAYFMPGNRQILYASTHMAADTCPQAPRTKDGKYVWGVFPEYDIFVGDLQGNVVKQLTNSPGYDAEATVSPDGQKIVFTSDRSGDLELYTMDIDGTNVQQVTDELGYDGGAFFSADSKRLVFRASRPKGEEAINTYKSLLAEGLVQPSEMEIFICNVDGSGMQQLTDLGGANWAPYFHPNGERVIFATNHHVPTGRQFNIFMINSNGTGLKQITYDKSFDAFPMFSHDGQQLVFSSNRNNGGTRETNVFLADWAEKIVIEME